MSYLNVRQAALASKNSAMRVLILGCGYAGLALGTRLLAAGHEVSGMRRSVEGIAELRARGIIPLRGDITGDLGEIGAFDILVNLASSSRGGPDEYRAVYLEGTRNVLSWMRAHPPRCYIYTSSTSVYAQTDGSVVTEESAAEPRNETSRILRETEELVLGQSHVPAIVLRTSGIYGPGRGHLFQQYLRGETVMRDNGSHYINMVHVEDVAGAIEHCLSNSVPDGLYNLTDDQPVTQRAFFEWLSMRLKKQMPPCAPADAKRKRGVTNKRVSNAKLRSTGYPFIFPSFREGYSEEMRRLGLI